MTDHKDKPVLNEQTFDRLLQAGYVLQEHNRKMRDLEARMESHSERLREQEAANQAALPTNKPKSKEHSRSDSDYTLTLAEIVEAQRQIQARHLALDKAMAVIAEKVARIAGATGAGIGILDEKTVRYRAGAGDPALPVGSEVPLARAVCAASIRTGQVIRSDDVNTEVLFDPEPVRGRGILSLVAVPIYHDGDIVGALELYFDSVHGYAEQDIHTCQLMAGLVTEAIGRDADSKLKTSLAEERSSMLAAIEKLRPNLAALAEDHSAVAGRSGLSPNVAAATASPCWKCGNMLLTEEQFCGKCGAPRDSDSKPVSMQSKLASAWHKQQGQAIPPNGNSHHSDAMNPVASVPESREGELAAGPSLTGSAAGEARFSSQTSESLPEEIPGVAEDEENVEASSSALVKPEGQEVVWSSAAKARDFLESLSGSRTETALGRFWQSRRGDFYLAVAVVLVIVVIRWGIWSNHPVGATSRGAAVSGSAKTHKQPAPDADLSTWDKMLIGLGLAEAPEPAEYKGNPDTQVWIDLHTALYYCPGSDLYEKTPKGRLATQRDAQLDQFEPANRKPCD